MINKRVIAKIPLPVLLGVAFLLAQGAGAAEQPTRTVVDETGRVVRVPVRIERVISRRRRAAKRGWATSSIPAWNESSS